MNKILLILLSFLLCNLTQAQIVKGIQKGNLVGVTFLDKNDKTISTIEPIYEEVHVLIDFQIAGTHLGDVYAESRNMHDSEFFEVPIDPQDPSKTLVDTVVTFGKKFLDGKLIMVKKDGKWGLLTIEGKEKIACIYDGIYPLNANSMQMYKQKDAPFFLLVMNGTQQILDQTGTVLVPDDKIPAYFKNRNKDLIIDALEVSFFGDYFLVNEGGTLFDSIVKVAAIKKVVNGKSKIITAAYEYNRFYYEGGKFNVWQFSTSKYLFEEASKNIEIHIQDANGTDYFESLNVRSIKSIDKFQENGRLGLVPAKISFISKD